MNKQILVPEIDGFYGAYYPNKKPSEKAMIIMLGDSSDDRLAISGANGSMNLAAMLLPCPQARKTTVIIIIQSKDLDPR